VRNLAAAGHGRHLLGPALGYRAPSAGYEVMQQAPCQSPHGSMPVCSVRYLVLCPSNAPLQGRSVLPSRHHPVDMLPTAALYVPW
jgi:hypothetical protein